MKKLVFTVALTAVLALGNVSCSKGTDGCKATALKTKIENCSNPDSVKVYVEEAQAYAQKLAKEGKIDQAREYLSKIEPAVKAKAPALAATLTTASEALGKFSEQAKSKAGEAADSVAAAATTAKEAVAQKAEDIKDATVQKTADVKDAAAQKVQEAKDATSDAAQTGADKVKELLK